MKFVIIKEGKYFQGLNQEIGRGKVCLGDVFFIIKGMKKGEGLDRCFYLFIVSVFVFWYSFIVEGIYII